MVDMFVHIIVEYGRVIKFVVITHEHSTKRFEI